MDELTGFGQIHKGATVILACDGEGQAHTVVKVLSPNTDKEEILLEEEGNLYFITAMAIDGSSWAKDVKFSNPQPYGVNK